MIFGIHEPGGTTVQHPRILAAKSLEELMEAIESIHDEEMDDETDPSDVYDEFDLPTFGGEPLEPREGLFSWDPERVLVGDTITDACIVTRAEYLAAVADEEPL
jgi:hypothetical protein